MKRPIATLSSKTKRVSSAISAKTKRAGAVKQPVTVATTTANSPSNALKNLQLGASVSLVALIFLCLAWETVLAPLKPEGSWLTLKAAFLCLPLLGILKGRRYTYQWACMFILFYFIEGCVRAWADVGLSAKLALFEVLLTTIFFFCAIYYAKLSAKLITKSANS